MKQKMTPQKYNRLIELRQKISWTYKDWLEANRLERLLKEGH